ncbi:hypothetical protein D1AOALGA4SA_8548 [Olavius algarvensis Delta 1 endosymbiont]|nr:hypothetical protein D1AOALGA4SA_8548 [Olavius algarvensis Delta 1 endosymbiont]
MLRRQRTDDRGQKTEDRGQKLEFGSGNAAFDKLRRDKVGMIRQIIEGSNRNLEVGPGDSR